MLFNSYEFILLFLPVSLLVFFRLGRSSPWRATAWLTAASLFFYGWWNPAYLLLLGGSILFNYLAGLAILRARRGCRPGPPRATLIAAIAADLALLGYYKYANFFLASVDAATGWGWQMQTVILPLGISFFTFTQIAFLVDTYRGEAAEYDFVHYALFVTYFPHLIAGPVLHHREIVPQFWRLSTYRPNAENFAVGLTIFAIGLFKKVMLADKVGGFVGPVYDHPIADPSFLEAWAATLAYTLQLYFDFSAYSDMAIGISRLFGIVLPLNFASPYKAVNISEFWRRWHMTLSRFLRDYLYIPLGGSRRGQARRQFNLMATMLLGGLWHGAGWTFVVWGGLHGLYLVINHAWQALCRRLGRDPTRPSLPGRIAGRLLTFLAVMIAWVFFRAPDMDVALHLVATMAGFHGVVLPETWLPQLGSLGEWLAAAGIARAGDLHGWAGRTEAYWLAGLLAVAWFAPNTQEIMAGFRPALDARPTAAWRRLRWQPRRGWAVIFAVVFAVALASANYQSEFLYYQF